LGNYIRHPEKRKRLRELVTIEADQKYLKLIMKRKKLNASEIAKSLKYNPDSVRRVLRYLVKVGLVRRIGRGTRYDPYIFLPTSSAKTSLSA
jgi:DNA-binding IclR family transcriptional regulator